MSRDLIARWTCNACRVNTETAADKQPKGWIGYGLTCSGAPLGEKGVIGHLCGTCAARIYEVMEDAR